MKRPWQVPPHRPADRPLRPEDSPPCAGLVDAIEILERETAPADPRLVGRDDHVAAGPVQPRNRVEASRDRFPVLRGTHVVREILVEHAVPVIAPIAFVIGAMVLAALQGPLTWRTFIDSLMGPRTPRA